jgi:hypothetical protein
MSCFPRSASGACLDIDVVPSVMTVLVLAAHASFRQEG